jgi:hypothetical protein
MMAIDNLVLALICIVFIALMAGFIVLEVYVLFRLIERRLHRCPNCKRIAGTIIETETIPRGTQLDRTGKELVRVKTERVIDHYQCERCQHTWTHSFERVERTPIRGAPTS